MKRRTLLKATLAHLLVTGTVCPLPSQASFPTQVFRKKDALEAMREAFGSADIAESDDIDIDVPAIAIDADLVPVRVKSNLPDTESISLIFEGNEAPFTAHYRIYENPGFVTTRLRLQDSGELMVVVKAGGMLHQRRRRVRVGKNMCLA